MQPCSSFRLAFPLALAFSAAACSATASDEASGQSALSSPAIEFLEQTAGDAPFSRTTSAFTGNRIAVVVRGLLPGEAVTLTSTIHGLDRRQRASGAFVPAAFVATASFVASGGGEIDTRIAEPTSGSYQGADPDGLVWSGIAQPAETGADSNDPALDLLVRRANGETMHGTLSRFATRSDVRVQEMDTVVDGVRVVGTYYAPATAKLHGAILAFSGSDGGLHTGETLGAYYASLGYPTLGLAYLKEQYHFASAHEALRESSLPSTLEDIPLEYFRAALDWLKTQPEVDGTRLAVASESRGGELALQVGATFPDVKAVVAFVPSPYRWMGVPSFTGGAGPKSAESLGGNELSYLGSPADFDFSHMPPPPMLDGVPVISIRDMYTAAFHAADPTKLAQARIPLENTQGAILMLGATDDQAWPSCDLTQAGIDGLEATGHVATWGDARDCYPGAGHQLGTPPGQSTVGTDVWAIAFGPTGKPVRYSGMGGMPAGIAHAQRAAYDHVRSFLAQHL